MILRTTPPVPRAGRINRPDATTDGNFLGGRHNSSNRLARPLRRLKSGTHHGMVVRAPPASCFCLFRACCLLVVHEPEPLGRPRHSETHQASLVMLPQDGGKASGLIDPDSDPLICVVRLAPKVLVIRRGQQQCISPWVVFSCRSTLRRGPVHPKLQAIESRGEPDLVYHFLFLIHCEPAHAMPRKIN
jgi:hypothetical protein